MTVRGMLVGVPEPAHLDENVLRFLNKLESCLVYHHDASLAGRDNTITRDLAVLLDERFLTDLYVDRPELTPLRIALEDTNLVILSGLLGSGKTTLLLKLEELLRQEGVHCLRLNVDAERSKLDALKGKPDPICALAYQKLRERYIDNNPDNALEFTAYEVQNNIRYGRLLSAIQTGYAQGRRLSSKEMAHALSQSPYREEKFELDMAPASDDDLVTLLSFLNQRIASLVVIFDNIDNFPASVPRDVINKCRRVLRGHCTPVVAVRASTLRQISNEEMVGRQGTQPEFLEIKKPYLARVPSSIAPASLPLSARSNTIQDVMQRRIRFLQKHVPNDELPKAFLERFNGRVEEFFSLRYASSFLYALSEWDNHSLRHVASDLSKFTASLVTGHDSLMSEAKLRAEAQKGKVRLAKSWLYKFLTCKDKLVYERDTGVTDVFDYTLGNGLIPFPVLALLLFLSQSMSPDADFRRGTATLAAVEEMFTAFGFVDVKSLTRHIVNRCVSPGLHGSLGKILVHNSKHELHPDSRPSTLLELQPRGTYLLEKLCFTTEYLFWTGLASTHASSHYRKYTYAETGKDLLRADVAAKFVTQVVGRKLRKAEELVHQTKKQELIAMYQRIFPHPGASSFVGGLGVSIGKFIAGVGGDEQVEAMLTELREDVTAWATSSGI